VIAKSYTQITSTKNNNTKDSRKFHLSPVSEDKNSAQDDHEWTAPGDIQLFGTKDDGTESRTVFSSHVALIESLCDGRLGILSHFLPDLHIHINPSFLLSMLCLSLSWKEHPKCRLTS
jgi:hypothetical protein